MRVRPIRWALSRRAFQFAVILPNLAFFTLAILAGLLGTPVGNANFAIVSVWIAWWALLIVLLVPIGGRAWCAMCPIPAIGEWTQRGAVLARGTSRPR
jgi:polyferredoxin